MKLIQSNKKIHFFSYRQVSRRRNILSTSRTLQIRKEEIYLNSIEELNIDHVDVRRNSGFDGYEIVFSVNRQLLCFLVGNTRQPFPLNVKHQFENKDKCRLCKKNVYPASFGHQLCIYFQNHLGLLLQYFQSRYPDRF